MMLGLTSWSTYQDDEHDTRTPRLMITVLMTKMLRLAAMVQAMDW